MAFKMKAGPGGPMKKNFPGAFKDTEGTHEDHHAEKELIESGERVFPTIVANDPEKE